jgi:hypothetical protein
VEEGRVCPQSAHKITASRRQKQILFDFVEAPRNLSKITASRRQKQILFDFVEIALYVDALFAIYS